MFRADAAHGGAYASQAPTLASVKWRFRTKAKIFSSPAVLDGIVYVGSGDFNVYAVRAADGALVWKFATKGPVNSSPAIWHGLVFIASLDGNVYGLDAASGTEKWRFKTGGERRFTAPGIHGIMPQNERMPDPFDVFLSSPAVAGGVVYVGSGDHNVYALDAETGARRWTFPTGDVVHASPAVSNGVVYVGSWDRNMYAIEVASGRELWRFQTGNDTTTYNQIGIASSAAVAGGTVFFGCRDGHFYAVDAATGRLRWSHDNRMGWVIASPAVKDGIVYFPTADGARFKAIDGNSGTLKYGIDAKNISFSSPAIVNDVVYLGTSDGWMHALDLATGAVRSEFQSDGNRANAAKYVDDTGRMKGAALYPDFTLDGMIIGVHNMFTLGSFLSSPVVADGILYVGSTDGHLYALK